MKEAVTLQDIVSDYVGERVTIKWNNGFYVHWLDGSAAAFMPLGNGKFKLGERVLDDPALD